MTARAALLAALALLSARSPAQAGAPHLNAPGPAAAPAMTGDDFRHGAGQWQIEAEAGHRAHVSVANGVMDIDTPAGLSVWWKYKITGPVAIDYDVMAVSHGGPNDAVSDVNAFWMARDPSAPGGSPLAHPRSGAFATYDTLRTYYVGIGGNRNTTTRLRRYIGEPGDRPLLPANDRSDKPAMLVPNRWLHVRLVADGEHIAVDYRGQRLFAMDDAEPYRSGWFALRTTKSHLKIRNFRITALRARDVAPKPLYRDTVHDGAADPSMIYDAGKREWAMFYTNRRADLPMADKSDVRWVHGTAIGIARSVDGVRWRYAGTAKIPAKCTGATLWAPDVERFGGMYHMWVSVVPGVFRDWNAPRFIVHLTSPDLVHWTCADRLNLGSDRVIDPSVIALPDGTYRLFFNDERMGKAIRSAHSTDLVHWATGARLTTTPGEGPKAFYWKKRWWLVSDAWKGLLVMSSPDAIHWTTQPGFILGAPGRFATDRAKGQHPDVIVSNGRAWIVYFVHQSGEDDTMAHPDLWRRSVLQIAELKETDGVLHVDRNAPTHVDLVPPATQARS